MEEADTRDDALRSLGFPAIGLGFIPSSLNLT
jgi:hypothetical protein